MADTIRFVGIDPGKTGGWACVTQDGVLLDCRQFTLYPDGDLDAASDIKVLLPYIDNVSRAVFAFERVHSMPKQGVKSMFSLGRALGTWEGALAVVSSIIDGCSKVEVSPREWQREFGVPTGLSYSQRKSRYISEAVRLFPSLGKLKRAEDGKAAAALIAEYARRQMVCTLKQK